MRIQPLTNHAFFGLLLANNKLLKRAYVKDIKPNSPSVCIISTLKATCQCLCGAFLISVNHHPVFTTVNIHQALQTIQDEGVYKKIEMTFAPEQKLSLRDVQKAANDYRLFAVL